MRKWGKGGQRRPWQRRLRTLGRRYRRWGGIGQRLSLRSLVLRGFPRKNPEIYPRECVAMRAM